MQTIIEAADAFLSHCRCERNLSPKTLKAYGTDIAQFLDYMADKASVPDLSSIDRNVLRDYIRVLVDRHKTRTVKRKVATLHGLFSHLEFEDTIPVNPFRKMRVSLKQERILPRSVPMRSIRRLFRYVYRGKDGRRGNRAVLRDIAVLEFLFTTGVRVSEASFLRTRDIDLRSGTVRIMGKGGRERMLPICSTEALEALREYAVAFDNEMVSSGWFFVNRNGRRFSAQSVRFMLRGYAREAGLGIHLTPHMLRHTVATQLVANGSDIRHVQYLLGHSSILTTQIYTHVDASSSRRILNTKHPRKTMDMRA